MAYEEWGMENWFDLSHTRAAQLMLQMKAPWEVLLHLADWIREEGKRLPSDRFQQIAEDVWVANSAVIAASASITGPAIIGERTEIRHCAFLRGSVLVGDDAVVGNSTECKNAILFDKVQVPHYNYVGDSILGYAAHLGAGAITSNVRADKEPVVIHFPEKSVVTGLAKSVTVHFSGKDVPTGMKKLGALVGDSAEIGCGAVLNPGVLVGPGAIVYPLSLVRGVVEPCSIYKKQGETAKRIF